MSRAGRWSWGMLVGLCWLLSITPAHAERPWQVGVALGYGARSNPLADGDALPLYADVDLAWFARRWFFDNGDLGLTLHDGSRFTLNAVLRGNSERVFFGRTSGPIGFLDVGFGPPLEDVVSVGGQAAVIIPAPDRKWALEGGLELLAEGRWGFLQGTLFHDLGGVHDGAELSLRYGIGWRRARWYLEPMIGLSWKSADLNNYYWGLRGDEVPLGAMPYRAGDGVNASARLSVTRYLTPRWSLVAALEVERLNRSVRRSPVVADSAVLGGFAGVSFRF